MVKTGIQKVEFMDPLVGKLNLKVELKWSLGQLVVSSTSVCWVMYNLYCLFHYVHS